MRVTSNGIRLSAFVSGALLVSVVIGGAGAGSAYADNRSGVVDDVQSIIRAETGDNAKLVTKKISSSGISVQKATSDSGEVVDTYIQKEDAEEGGGVSVFAVLDDGQDSARFSNLLNEGLSFKLSEGGGLAVIDEQGQAVGVVEAPWARDAAGVSLPTSYRLDGNDIVQDVDTTNAVFPVVADPSLSIGLNGALPVYKVKFTWTETNKIKKLMDDSTTAVAIGSACGLIGNNLAKAACATGGTAAFSGFKSKVNSAIKNKKCVRLMIPYGLPVQTVGFGVDTVKCSS
ncbi:hypothetical protein KIH74_00565 [Kineosporia sp. J2-2]|uniref:Uncharacterized protein n=1 Tax=Kineosporia corallincola TaxID=2835133 RepID=A0ABS5T8J4_9ACTN|nr:hypothetical protein [Kineosporia corallincola]MBT0767392.1 hypothetical protein [Kineosporia corallincola]